MAYTLTLPEGYGYVVLVALGAMPFLSWMQGNLVGVYRKPAKVPYPNAYASQEKAKESREAYQFNCAQRAHGNLLENMPQTMAFMLFAGLENPKAAAGLGVGWIVMRIVFAYGYITSTKPNGQGRHFGAGYLLMQAGLWGLCCRTALKML